MTRIVVFAKEPVPGRVKTRLIPVLGAEAAAALAAEMLERAVAEALASGCDVELCGDPHPAGWWRGAAVALEAQGPGDLGDRLAHAAERGLRHGPVLLIGSDCPGLDRRRLREAAEALQSRDAVLHPTQDGGYALLGLRAFERSLFTGVAWSTGAVAAETTARITALAWSLHVGDTLRDVDEPADLALLAPR
jgi:rSAM/selenodomain-associated transferase 1